MILRLGIPAVLMCAALAGCQALGAVAYKLTGNPEVKPQYAPAQAPTLVLAESLNAGSATDSEAGELALLIGKELRDHQVAPLIGQEEVSRLRSRGEQEFRKMSMTAVGRAAGAKQVVYVAIESYEFGPMAGNDAVAGNIQAKVRLIDVDSGTVLWPAQEAGQPVAYKVGPRAMTDSVTSATVRQEVLSGLALKVGRLFYAYRPEGNEGHE